MRILFILCSFIIGIHDAIAQISFKPIVKSRDAGTVNLRISGSERDSTKLELPFWDDFSRTSYLPDTSHWFVDDGTSNISASLGIDPPTVNVAVFDGWNLLGTPYSSSQLEEGEGDSLVSRFIDLSKINPALRETVYISFFWQKEGRGEMPDDEDFIRLQAMDSEKTWKTIWNKSGREITDTDVFTQEIIQVNDPSFYHAYFQFRFQTFGNLSGGFDTWNIDYVYMNFNRTPTDLFFEDRALTTPPTSWLTTYSAMPYDHFILNLENNLEPTRVGVSNLDDQVQPVEYYALIRDSVRIFDEMNQGTPLNLAPNSIAEIVSEPIDPNAFDPDADSISLLLETRFFINSGDSSNWFDKYDFRSNDTTISITELADELAYDDGTAEWGAGLSQKSGKLAYRYIIPKSDAITALKIYFPDFVPSSVGKTFTLIIWDDLLPNREGRLLTEQHIVQKSGKLNEFTTYTLGRPVVVSDTFYIGYEQSVNDFFPIGLDKFGKAQSGNIFINIDGVWESSNIIEGNLMIRPVFGFEKAVGFEDELFGDIVIYPNPNRGDFSIKGNFERASLTDIRGYSIMEIKGGSEDTQIIITNKSSGLYLLNITKEGRHRTFKVIVR
ncbi:MAG: T9SS type A sorting domain-containing protein [Cytophagales bacterium]|nr:T9SS type A sorting domain-containing protein [Cytophagales bacterium]